MEMFKDDKQAVQTVIDGLFTKIDQQCRQLNQEKQTLEGTIVELNDKLSKVVAELSTKQETADNYHRVSFVANLNKQITEKDKTIKQLHATIEKLKVQLAQNSSQHHIQTSTQATQTSNTTPTTGSKQTTTTKIIETKSSECEHLSNDQIIDENLDETVGETTTDENNNEHIDDSKGSLCKVNNDARLTDDELLADNEPSVDNEPSADAERLVDDAPSADDDEEYDTKIIDGKEYLCHKDTNKVYMEQGDYLIHVGRITSKGELKLKKKKQQSTI